jgi:SAM-dependent methyltransferase
MPARLVEIGAGNGTVALALQSAGVDVTAVEPSEIGAELMRRRGVSDVRCQLLEDAAFPDGSVEAVGLFDVLEHLPEPRPLLREVHRILQPGGRCLVTVPALPWMWSDFDEFSGHHRRYDRKSLIAEHAAADLTVLVCQYRFLGALVPLAATRVVAHRLGRRRSEARIEADMLRQLRGGGLLPRLLTYEMRAEEWFARRYPLPCGSSLVACFVKPASTSEPGTTAP